jgi:AcrR family transcriptional regulator
VPENQESNGPPIGHVPGLSAVPLKLLRTRPARERADAARNRAAILEAASRLFTEHGIDGVSLEQVAVAAGVGKGTLFRRFGDKSGLAAALLDSHERVLQEAVLDGPPPLGPGAPVTERLTAFLDAYLDHLVEQLDLIRLAETASPGARYRAGTYRFWHRHLATLLSATPDPDYIAHGLLAALAAEHVSALWQELGEQRIRDGLRRSALTALRAGM